MNLPKIRPLALCVFRYEDRIFVSKGYDSRKDEAFYRPIGGGIEFGEYGKQAVTREVREEIAAEIDHVTLLGTLENIFTYNGKPGHELVLLYQADFVDPTFYQETEREVIEGGRVVSAASWILLDFFLRKEAPLYPDGILEILKREWSLA